MKHQYKNLQISSVDYGFGWIYKDDPSTKTIDELLVVINESMGKLVEECELLMDILREKYTTEEGARDENL